MKINWGWLLFFLLVILIGCSADDCSSVNATSDTQQTFQQEKVLKEGVAQTGMPAIKNFRERKLLKDILELRDQTGLTTYVYLQAEMTGKLIYLGEAIGYGIPYATEYTSPQRPALSMETHEQGNITVPQADPNGLFSPASAEGTWILMKDPNGDSVKPIYIEPRIVVSPFKLNTN